MQISITGVQATEAMLHRLSLLDTIVQEWFATGEHDRIMQESFEENFEAQGRPKWDVLDEATAERRERAGFSPYEPILVQTGNFKDEITSLESSVERGIGQTIATWGVDGLRPSEREKFIAHQQGTQYMPARKSVGFNPGDAEALKESLGNFIQRNFV